MKTLAALGLLLAACTSPNGAVEDEGPAGADAERAPDATADATPADSSTPAPPDARGTPSEPADARGAPPDAAPAPADMGADEGPSISFYIRTSTAPFPHADGLSGQTARAAFQGIRSFTLLRDADDPEPLVVLDLGDAPVEAGYNDGNTTLVGSTRLSALRPGHYTLGRNVVTHSRYRVDAVMHAAGLVLPGEFDNVQVLTADTRVDGVPRAQGWFRYVFRTAGREFPLEGEGAPLPTEPTSGGFRLVVRDGEAFYDYPIDVTIPELPAQAADLSVVLDVNMDHAFRWEDQAQPGYVPLVFDSSPAGSEPVRRFGANRLGITTE